MAQVQFNPTYAPLPRPITSFGAAVEGDWLYVIGGHWGKPHHYSADSYSTAFRRLNLLDRTTWQDLPGGIARQSVALVAHDGFVYRVGGATALNKPGEENDMHSTAEFARFNVETLAWEPLPDLPEPRSSHDAFVYEGKLYVAGGWILGGKDVEPVWHETAWMMDLVDGAWQWQAMPNPPFQRRAIGLAGAHGRIYAIGGMKPEGKTSTEVDVFDVATQTWSKGPAYPFGEFHAVAACAVGGVVYANGLDGTVYRLDAPDGPWQRVCDLQFPRFFHRLQPMGGGELVAVGGAAHGGKISMIESVDVRSGRDGQWSTWILPVASKAKNRQGVLASENALYVFGGNNSPAQHDFEKENFLSAGYLIHPGSLSSKPAAPFPIARQSMQTIVVGEGKLRMGYAVGGFGNENGVARAFDDVYRYSFVDEKWEQLAAMPRPRTQFGLCHYDDALWVFGGLDYDARRDDDDFIHVQDVLHMPLVGGERVFVDSGKRLPQPRRAFGGALLGDRYYLIGGMREDFELVETCDVFDFANDSWQSITPPAVTRISPELVALDGKLYLAGGSSRDERGKFRPNSTIEVYDPQAATWTTVCDSLPISARHLRVFPFNGQLMFYSTHSEGSNAVQLALWRPGDTAAAVMATGN